MSSTQLRCCSTVATAGAANYNKRRLSYKLITHHCTRFSTAADEVAHEPMSSAPSGISAVVLSSHTCPSITLVSTVGVKLDKP